MKNVLVISSSLRKNSNSDKMAEAFAQGAMENGHNVEIVSLKDKNLAFCRGCMACQTTGECVIKDDAIAITQKMLNADVIAFASPVYYYSISGQLKTLFDRANSLFTADYSFRDIYLLTCAAEDESYTPEGAQKAVQGWVDCFEKAELKGVVFVGGVTEPGEISQASLSASYEAGKNI